MQKAHRVYSKDITQTRGGGPGPRAPTTKSGAGGKGPRATRTLDTDPERDARQAVATIYPGCPPENATHGPGAVVTVYHQGISETPATRERDAR